MSIALVYIAFLGVVYTGLAVAIVRNIISAQSIYLGLTFYVMVLSAGIYLADTGNSKSRGLLIDAEASLLLQALIISVFSITLLAGFMIGRRANPVAGIFPVFTRNQDEGLMTLGLVLLTAGAVAVFAFPLAVKGGDVIQTIGYIRHGDALKGYNFLVFFQRIGSLLTAAYWVVLLWRKKDGIRVPRARFRLIGLLFLLNLVSGLMLGGKNFIAYPVIAFSVSYAVFMTRRPVIFLGTAAAILLVLLGLMQYQRIVTVKQGAEFRPVFHTLNAVGLTLIDHNQVYLQTMTNRRHTSIGEDFFNGMTGVVPRSLWPGKPDQITAGGRFKDTVQPGLSGGWPVFGCNQWYGNFGWLGVVFGGLFTGLVLAAIATRYRHAYRDPFAMTFLVYFTILFVVPGGLENMMFVKYMKNVLPLFIFKMLSHKALIPQEIKAGKV